MSEAQICKTNQSVTIKESKNMSMAGKDMIENSATSFERDQDGTWLECGEKRAEMEHVCKKTSLEANKDYCD